jgi:serine/threonine-protein phosphatase PPG1
VLFDDQLSTVWSAPNYCYRCGNIASVMEINESLDRNFNTFDAAPENEKNKPESEDTKDVPDYFI